MKVARFVAVPMMTLAFGLFACSKSDSRCNQANCDALLTCRLILFPAPPCGSLPLGNESAAMLEEQGWQACINACNAGGNGQLVQCVADNFPGETCTNVILDGGDLYTTITTRCAVPPCGPNCTKCWNQCGAANSTCTAPCLDAGTIGACVSCSGACGEQWAGCGAACPTD